MHRCSIFWFAPPGSVLSAPVAGLYPNSAEFKVKRREALGFAERPGVSRDATCQRDRFVIRFASEAVLDSTVAIEGATKRIIRHLVSGVFSPNASEPFRRDSLNQTITWDAKGAWPAFTRVISGM